MKKQEQQKVFSIAHGLVADLKSCSTRRDLQCGRHIHERAVATGNDSNKYVVTALIKMYSKCGSMVNAHRVFDTIKQPDVVSWNVLLLGYAENGEGRTTLELFSRMKATGCAPDSITYIATLKACVSLIENGAGKEGSLKLGRGIHKEVRLELIPMNLLNTLIDMYAKCGSMADARRIFYQMEQPDAVSWNILLLGFAETGEGFIALDLFKEMKARGCECNSGTYVAVLKACTSLAVNGDTSKKECLERGREIHLEVGCHLNNQVQSTLIDLYAKCGCTQEARSVFDSVKNPDVVSWTVMIMGYAENGDGSAALELFSIMKERHCVPNFVTYVAALKACISLAQNVDENGKGDCLKLGRIIHTEVGSHMDLYVQTTLVEMYSKLGSMHEARDVFNNIRKPDVVSWTALILGYAENGEGYNALSCFSKMKASGCIPNSVTYVAALKACTSLAMNGEKIDCLQLGKEIHSQVGCHLHHYVQNTLIDMYANGGCMEDAHRVFDSIGKPDVVSWTALLLGYVDNGEGYVAIDLFRRMKAQGCNPDPVTYVAVIKACGLLGALALGRKFHLDINEFTTRLVSCLVDFYAKCGSLEEAREVFDLHRNSRVTPTWNVMLAAYGSFGEINSVFKLFESMKYEGCRPDAITFVCMLLSCSHAGLVAKAVEYFEAMSVHGVVPTIMHYTCMVDVLGRANQLGNALQLLHKMPCSPDAVTWRTLLSAAYKWKNVEIGRLAFQALVGFDKNDASAHVLMSHIYGTKGMLEEQRRVLETRLGNVEELCEQELGIGQNGLAEVG